MPTWNIINYRLERKSFQAVALYGFTSWTNEISGEKSRWDHPRWDHPRKTSKTCWTLLISGSPLDFYIWTHQCGSTSKNLHLPALYGYRVLSWAKMADRDRERERGGGQTDRQTERERERERERAKEIRVDSIFDDYDIDDDMIH